MKEELRLLIEDQINKELWSGYLYYGMAEYVRSLGLDGYHKFFVDHAKEECEHAAKFCDFLQDRDVPFSFKAIAPLNEKFNGLEDVLKFQLAHEQLVTSLIEKIYRKAKEVDDPVVANFMGWYLTEQVEEEKEARGMLDDFHNFGQCGAGLLALNKALLK